jgi:mRNA interferase MazF
VSRALQTAPRRWHVYVIDLEPRVGTKPGKQRPCVAVQPTEFAEAGLPSTVILPITTRLVRAEAFPLRVRLPAGACRLTQESDVLVDQILAWDNRLFREDLGPLPEALQDEIRRALLEFLDLA